MTSSFNILVTGATGFIGQALVKELGARGGFNVRSLSLKNTSKAVFAPAPDASGQAPAASHLADDIDVVVHLAGRAHILKETASDPMQLYRVDNVDKTLELAKWAMRSGVKRFVFVSSIGVNGSTTQAGPFSEDSAPAPKADYAISKLEAEIALQALLQGSAMELVIIRPPLVYAGHAPGNFRRLMQLVNTGLPLPFARVENSRSMVALENLVDFIICCTRHPLAANETFLIADGVDLSISQIAQYLAQGLGRPTRLWPVPLSIMALVARLLGVKGMFEQLFQSLTIDSSKARKLLHWQPPLTPQQALPKAGADYLDASRKQV